MPINRDRERLELILQLVGDLERRVVGMSMHAFVEDGDERDLTAFRLSHVGENANKLSDDLKARHPELPWGEMYGFRNLIAHEYLVIDPRRVWQVAQNLAPIKAMCLAELAAFPDAP